MPGIRGTVFVGRAFASSAAVDSSASEGSRSPPKAMRTKKAKTASRRRPRRMDASSAGRDLWRDSPTRIPPEIFWN